MGFYPAVMPEAEYQRLKSDEQAQAALFKKLVLERVREWAEWAAEKLKGCEVPFVAIPGNDDFEEIDDILTKAPRIDFHEMQVCEFKGGYQMRRVDAHTLGHRAGIYRGAVR